VKERNVQQGGVKREQDNTAIMSCGIFEKVVYYAVWEQKNVG